MKNVEANTTTTTDQTATVAEQDANVAPTKPAAKKKASAKKAAPKSKESAKAKAKAKPAKAAAAKDETKKPAKAPTTTEPGILRPESKGGKVLALISRPN